MIRIKELAIIWLLCCVIVAVMTGDIIVHLRTVCPISKEKQDCLNAFTKQLGEKVCKDK